MSPPEGDEEEFVTHHCMMIIYISDTGFHLEKLSRGGRKLRTWGGGGNV